MCCLFTSVLVPHCGKKPSLTIDANTCSFNFSSNELNHVSIPYPAIEEPRDAPKERRYNYLLSYFKIGSLPKLPVLPIHTSRFRKNIQPLPLRLILLFTDLIISVCCDKNINFLQ